MANPIHPNEFAVRQEVLFRQHDDRNWREGTIKAVAVDETKSRELHSGPCDEHQYAIADAADRKLVRADREKRIVYGCMCQIMIADSDATGRWHGQRLGGGIGLALLLVDAKRRGRHVVTDCAVSEVDDPEDPDVIRFLEMPGYHHLASARVDDLVEWASGIPAADWKEPTE